MTEQSSDQPSMEAINYGPDVAREQPELLLQAIKASGEFSDHLYGYVQTGDLEPLRKALNAALVMATMRTRGEFTEMLSRMTRGERLLTDAQREKAKEALKQNGNA